MKKLEEYATRCKSRYILYETTRPVEEGLFELTEESTKEMRL